MVPDHVREKHNFIRKGIVGDGKSHFVSSVVEEEFDNWVLENNKDDDGNVIDPTHLVCTPHAQTCGSSHAASFTEALIIVKIFKIDVFISAERGKQGGFDGISFN